MRAEPDGVLDNVGDGAMQIVRSRRDGDMLGSVVNDLVSASDLKGRTRSDSRPAAATAQEERQFVVKRQLQQFIGQRRIKRGRRN